MFTSTSSATISASTASPFSSTAKHLSPSPSYAKPKSYLLFTTKLEILSKYVDVCIFYRRTMQPVLAIDLFNSNPIKQTLKKMDSDVYEALKIANIPIVEIKLVDNYDINILRKNIFDCLPPKIFALIKDK